MTILELKANEGISVSTLKEAALICMKFASLGLTWRDGSSYLTKYNWHHFKEGSIYYPKEGTVGNGGNLILGKKKIYPVKAFLEEDNICEYGDHQYNY